MRVLLINPDNYGFSSSPPLGIGYIASNLIKHNYSVDIFDKVPLIGKKMSNENINDLLIKKIVTFNPDIVGLSMMSCQIKDSQSIVKLLRSRFKDQLKIVVGGIHPTVEPENTFKLLKNIDYVIIDEAEETFIELVSGKNIREIKSVYYKDNNEIIFTGKRIKNKNIDLLPPPARHLFDMEFYCKKRKATVQWVESQATTILTSRGCPGRCTFCVSNRIGLPIRWHSPEYVVNELESIVNNYTVECVSFIDTMFISKKDRVFKICDLIIEKGLNKKIRWSASVRTDYIDDEILIKMKEAGCFHITFGIESGSQATLDKMNKRNTIIKNTEAISKAKKYGYLVNASFIYDYPGETFDDINKTFEFIKKTKPYFSGINKFTPLFGSKIYCDIFEKNNVSDENINECGFISKKYYSKVSEKTLETITKKNTILRYINNLNFLFYRFFDYNCDVYLQKNIDRFNNYFILYYLKGDYKKFISFIEENIITKILNVYVVKFYVANSYYYLKEFSKVEKIYKELSEKTDRLEVLNNYACVLYSNCKKVEALKIWNNILKIKSDYGDVKKNILCKDSPIITKLFFNK